MEKTTARWSYGASVGERPVYGEPGDPRNDWPLSEAELLSNLASFSDFGTITAVTKFVQLVPSAPVGVHQLPVFVNEFWTAKQRAGHSLHEISYRACFKPQLPRFFIERLTFPRDVVYDPFMGRGTTLLEAALLGRRIIGADISPLSRVLVEPRLFCPTVDEIRARLDALDLLVPTVARDDLLAFYHPNTLRQLSALREYLRRRQTDGMLDYVDKWIQMVATNRLTGHSPGFFSVYTLPPNQATSVERQLKINEKRNQTPPERDIKQIILKKSRSLLSDLQETERAQLAEQFQDVQLLTASAESTPEIADKTVSLVVTSPPFLDVVDYERDNWLRCWFNDIDLNAIKIWQHRKEGQWQEAMKGVFMELHRVLKPGGYVAFEVGEVRGGSLLLEKLVVPAALEAGLRPVLILVNQQEFTKTANCWGVSNLTDGTNTNRVVLLRRD